MEKEQVHREDPLRLGLLAMLSPGLTWADDSQILRAVREVLGSRAEAIRLATMRLDDQRADDAKHKATRDELATLRVALTRELLGEHHAAVDDELAIKEVRWLRERADASEEAWRDVRALRTRMCEVLAPVAIGPFRAGDAALIDEVAALVQAHRDTLRLLEELRRARPDATALRLSLVAALPAIQGWTPTDADIVAEVAGLVDAVRSVAADDATDADALDALLEALGTTEEMGVMEAAEQVRTHLRTVDRYHALRADLVDAIGERDSAKDPDIVARVEWMARVQAEVKAAPAGDVWEEVLSIMHTGGFERYDSDPSVGFMVKRLVTGWKSMCSLYDAAEAETQAIHELLDASGVPWGEGDTYGADLLPRLAWLVGWLRPPTQERH